MPITRTTDHLPLSPDKTETLDRRAVWILAELEVRCRPGLLYTDKELLVLLKESNCQIDHDLWRAGYGKTNLTGNIHTHTPLRTMLQNLWLNGYIRKFGTGIYDFSGRATGVVWEIL